jgi:hypothetical protein
LDIYCICNMELQHGINTKMSFENYLCSSKLSS